MNRKPYGHKTAACFLQAQGTFSTEHCLASKYFVLQERFVLLRSKDRVPKHFSCPQGELGWRMLDLSWPWCEWFDWPKEIELSPAVGRKKSWERSQELCSRLITQASLKTGFLLVMLCGTPALGTCKPECFLILVFLLQGQGVPFLFQVCFLDLDPRWKAAK